jgi:hypothetical protein
MDEWPMNWRYFLSSEPCWAVAQAAGRRRTTAEAAVRLRNAGVGHGRTGHLRHERVTVTGRRGGVQNCFKIAGGPARCGAGCKASHSIVGIVGP